MYECSRDAEHKYYTRAVSSGKSYELVMSNWVHRKVL